MHGNARGIAAAQSVLANGGAYGKRLLFDAGRQQVLRIITCPAMEAMNSPKS
jgi:hypothetical protein